MVVALCWPAAKARHPCRFANAISFGASEARPVRERAHVDEDLSGVAIDARKAQMEIRSERQRRMDSSPTHKLSKDSRHFPGTHVSIADPIQSVPGTIAP